MTPATTIYDSPSLALLDTPGMPITLRVGGRHYAISAADLDALCAAWTAHRRQQSCPHERWQRQITGGEVCDVCGASR